MPSLAVGAAVFLVVDTRACLYLAVHCAKLGVLQSEGECRLFQIVRNHYSTAIFSVSFFLLGVRKMFV
jgi:hypothetical protein